MDTSAARRAGIAIVSVLAVSSCTTDIAKIRGGGIAGRVVTCGGSVPVRGARVAVKTAHGEPPLNPTTDVTDDFGVFGVDGLAARTVASGGYVLEVEAPGHEPQPFDGPFPVEDGKLTRLSGDLCLPIIGTSTSTARVQVVVWQPAAADVGGLKAFTDEVRLTFDFGDDSTPFTGDDPEGTIALPNVIARDYRRVLAAADGRLTALHRRVSVREAESVTLQFALLPEPTEGGAPEEFAMAGVLTGAAGAPIEGARVRLVWGMADAPGAATGTSGTDRYWSTDARGRFVVQGAKVRDAGRTFDYYALWLSPPEATPGAFATRVDRVDAGDLLEGGVLMRDVPAPATDDARDFRIRGRVVKADGTAVEDVALGLFSGADPKLSGARGWTQSDAAEPNKGRFGFRVPGDATTDSVFTLVAAKEGFQNLRHVVTLAGTERSADVELVLVAGASPMNEAFLTPARVLDRVTGGPIAGANVKLRPLASADATPGGADAVADDATGTFTLPSVAAGEYVVIVTPPDGTTRYVGEDRRRVTLTAGASATLEDFHLWPLRAHVRLEDPDGADVQCEGDCDVTLYDGERTLDLTPDAATDHDVDGSGIGFDLLKSGVYLIVARPSGLPAVHQPIRLTADASYADIVLQVRPGDASAAAGVGGRVVDAASGAGIGEVVLRLVDAGTRAEVARTTSQSAGDAGDVAAEWGRPGWFTFPRVAPGIHEVEVDTPAGFAPFAPVPVALQAERTRFLRVALAPHRLDVLVRDSTLGNVPVAGAGVVVYAGGTFAPEEASVEHAAGETDGAGRVSFDLAAGDGPPATGTFTVVAQAQGLGAAATGVEISATRPFALSTLDLRTETAVPLADAAGLSGQVLLGDAPGGGVPVEWNNPGDPVTTVTTGPDGLFTFFPVEPDVTLTLRPKADCRYASPDDARPVVLPGTFAFVTLQLTPRQLTIAGTAGAAPGVEVELYADDGLPPIQVTTTADGGTFSFSDPLPPGRYEVRAFAPEAARQASVRVELKCDAGGTLVADPAVVVLDVSPVAP